MYAQPLLPLVIFFVWYIYTYVSLTFRDFTDNLFFEKSEQSLRVLNGGTFNERKVTLVTLSYLIFYFTVFLKGCEVQNGWLYFTNSTVLQIKCLLFVSLAYAFCLKNNLAQFWYHHTNYFILTGIAALLCNNLFFFLLILETNNYTWIMIMFLQYQATKNKKNKKGLSKALFFQLFLNFVGTLLLFWSLTQMVFFYGDSTYTFFRTGYGMPNNNSTFKLLLMSAFFIKISQGPWAVWFLRIYANLLKENIVMYLIVFLFTLLPYLLGIIEQLTINKLNTLVFLQAAGLLVLGHKALFRLWTLKTWLVFSSFISYLYIFLIFSVVL